MLTSICCGTVVGKETPSTEDFKVSPKKEKYERLIIALLENELLQFCKSVPSSDIKGQKCFRMERKWYGYRLSNSSEICNKFQ